MNALIIVRGGGDLATGTILKLSQCGFSVLVLEIPRPSAVRRNVAFSEAVYAGSKTVEGVTCHLARNIDEARALLAAGELTMLIDPACRCLGTLRPLALVDATIAKRNLGTRRDMAPVTIALGPGFTAGEDVDAVIETKRGHNLGRVIYAGPAAPNTGVPGEIGGYSLERVLRSPVPGIFRAERRITDIVRKGEPIGHVETPEGERVPMPATMDGLLRGLLPDGYPVTKGFKLADIDPRVSEYENCFTVSDKARCIAGGVLEAVLHLRKERGL